MKKINTSPISGTQELLPSLQAEFNRLKSGIAEAFQRHGFQNIETPMIERTEVLLAKAGGETEKQIYKVIKTDEAADEADQALRFDHTVSLARYTVEHMNDLAFPFKVSQIGRNFRGERAQKGRFREFYQCDVDVIGWGKLPLAYDAEVILTLGEALKVLPLPADFYFRVSNRKILSGVLEELNLEHLGAEIFGIVDHAEKVSQAETVAALAALGLGSELIERLLDLIEIRGERGEAIQRLQALGFEGETFRAGVAELDEVLRLLTEVLGAPSGDGVSTTNVIADLKIVRGLDYYTGTVFETLVHGYERIGSICSGGRYENLAGNYTQQRLPGVGGSIGLTRLFYVLQDCGAVRASEAKAVGVCVLPMGEELYGAAADAAERLRAQGQSVDLCLSGKKLGDQLRYAAKVADFALIVGENEVASGVYSLKNLRTGETTGVRLD